METLRKLTDKKIKSGIIGGFSAAGLVFQLIFMFSFVPSTQGSVWGSAAFWVNNKNFVPTVCMACIIGFFVSLAASGVAVLLSLKGKKSYMWPTAISFFGTVLLLALCSAFKAVASSWALIIAAVFYLPAFLYSAFCVIADGRGSFTALSASKRGFTVMGGISVFTVLSLFYTPLCFYTVGTTEPITYSVVPMGAFSSQADNLLCLAAFALLCLAAAVNVFRLSGALKFFGIDDGAYCDKLRGLINLNTVITGIYAVVGVLLCSLNNSKGGNYSTAAFIPFIASVIMAVIGAVLSRGVSKNERLSEKKVKLALRIEFFIYATLVSLITVASCFMDIIKVSFENVPILTDLNINGYNILTTYNSNEGGLQLMAFLLFAILTVTAGLFIVSLISLISGSKLFFKVALVQLVSGGFFTLLIGLFGKYYEIVQRLNEETVSSLIRLLTGVTVDVFKYKVSGPAFYFFIAALVVIAVAIIRKPYSKGTLGETPVMVTSGGAAAISGPAAPAASAPVADPAVADPCPAFTEIDKKQEYFAEDTRARRAVGFRDVSLVSLVQFVVSYARDCRLHLSYTHEDIAAFIAGLGSTRLTILQGMSGTGKTSLPKIFSEAVLGNCEIIEVESSWRDKNELLGYYNEFSKTYTPKKFTQALYKARLNPETVTFIVLDEMNLSRIEYYFSDFLSLMENEEDKREIKLLNVPLYKNEEGMLTSYAGLTDGHTLKVPSNVWFIGTANRDESTFEISDKVYDRAHTMNFNKRAAKPTSYGAPIPQQYLTVDTFAALLEAAKSSVRFQIESYPLIREVEALLAPYNISFGNRIANQIESFVNIYCACFTNSDAVIFDAVEKILLSKVVSKLEVKSVENKSRLAAEFEKRGLRRCSEFILKLNED